MVEWHPPLLQAEVEEHHRKKQSDKCEQRIRRNYKFSKIGS